MKFFRVFLILRGLSTPNFIRLLFINDMSFNILGVRIDEVSANEALQKAKNFLVTGQHQIFTPNPEMLVKAAEDQNFRSTLNRGDLNICDGTGLQMAVRHLHGKKIDRITGVDFMLQLCKQAEQQKCSIYLLGSGDDKVLEKTAANLLFQFPTLNIVGKDKGPTITESASGLIIEGGANAAVVEKINHAKPDILFVAFGMGKQEKWLDQNLSSMPSIRIGMGIGGAFDYISGAVTRAPLLWRKFGLEWAYRLVKQPGRLGRIWNATVVFPWMLFKTNIFFPAKNR